MNYTFDKKSKKSLKSSQRRVSLGIPTNIAAGPLGFQGDRPDSTATLDEQNQKAARILFNDKKSEGQGPSGPRTSTIGVVVSGTEERPTGE